jgi:hypothetical protein
MLAPISLRVQVTEEPLDEAQPVGPTAPPLIPSVRVSAAPPSRPPPLTVDGLPHYLSSTVCRSQSCPEPQSYSRSRRTPIRFTRAPPRRHRSAPLGKPTAGTVPPIFSSCGVSLRYSSSCRTTEVVSPIFLTGRCLRAASKHR